MDAVLTLAKKNQSIETKISFCSAKWSYTSHKMSR